jgi:uncharacterized NAD(P)/FAD-binding protein YdhS
MHIAIIGGGFAGAACALHLLRDHPSLDAALSVIEPRATLGAGLAYSTTASEHRTNVAATRMSVFPEDALHFDRWLRSEGDPGGDPASEMPDGRLYPRRAVFGRYVQSMLLDQVAARPGVTFRHVRDRAEQVAPAAGGWRIRLAGGDTLVAGCLVLAVSHTAPDLPAVLRGIDGVIADPWDVGAVGSIPADARVLVVGTGLTACDVIASLLARGHRGGITAVSRHGMLPRPRTTLPVEAEGDFSTAPETSASALLRRIRRAVAVATAAGRPWENIVDALRQQSASAWGTLDWTERRRLLRHLRTYWDVHRFQSAPQIDAALAEARQSGRLQIMAASLVGCGARPAGLGIDVRPRGAPAEAVRTLEVDAVVNCTGPGHRSVTASHPVLRCLSETAGLQADPARLGILVDATGRVMRPDGSAWRTLFVAGPLARGTYGELMGLPQVNLQPRQVAAELALLAGEAGRTAPLPETAGTA